MVGLEGRIGDEGEEAKHAKQCREEIEHRQEESRTVGDFLAPQPHRNATRQANDQTETDDRYADDYMHEGENTAYSGL